MGFYEQASAPALRVVRDEPAAYDVVEPGRFAMTPNDVLTDTRLSPGARCTYGILALFWWRDAAADKLCQVGHERLVELSGFSLSTLKRYLIELMRYEHIGRRPPAPGRTVGYFPKLTEPNREPRRSSQPSPSADSVDALPSPSADSVNADTLSLERDTRETMTTSSERARTRPRTKAASDKPAMRSSRLPVGWALTDEHYAAADRIGLDRARATSEADRFADYHRARGSLMLDWLAAWRTWCRNALDFDARSSNGSGYARTPRPRSGGPTNAISAEMRDRLSAVERRTPEEALAVARRVAAEQDAARQRGAVG